MATPKLPPPPCSAQKSSGFSSADAVSTRPSAVTTSAETRLSQASPILRSSQPLPPPSTKPPTPVVDTRPPVVASRCGSVARSRWLIVAPPPATATRAAGSTLTPFIRRRSITSPSSQSARPATPWPPPRTAISSPASRAKRTAATTSAVEAHCAITAGLRSIIALKSTRASS